MKFAMFYEIPVAKPWTRTSELEAYRDTIEQVNVANGEVISRLHCPLDGVAMLSVDSTASRFAALSGTDRVVHEHKEEPAERDGHDKGQSNEISVGESLRPDLRIQPLHDPRNDSEHDRRSQAHGFHGAAESLELTGFLRDVDDLVMATHGFILCKVRT